MSISREIVGFAMEAGSSDIHLEEESPIAVRVNSDIKVSPQKLESEDQSFCSTSFQYLHVASK